MDEWVVSTGIVRKPASMARFANADFAGFAAATYPDTDVAGVLLMADWFAWLFLVDDELDDGITGTRPDHIGAVLADIATTLRAPDDITAIPVGNTGAVRALGDLWARTAPRATSGWRRRFGAHVGECFTAAAWEAGNRVHEVVPDEAVYVERRRHTGAIYVCMDLIEPMRDTELADDVLAHPVFQDALDAACDVVCWTNDVFSLEKERRLGEWHNLVAVVGHARGLSDQDALPVACDMIGARTAEYVEHEAALLAEFDTEPVRRYVEGMRTWIRGNLDWSRATHRYREGASDEHAGRYLEPSLMGGSS
ncbi:MULTISPECIES: terpene synthase family protein [Saccharothrix]|uniref:terpene synthase family protein n=1 Tax=Saccharothrix TaxID=2071 RepID=UPI0009679D74|nr:hypothetical protein [Saccharothrix sp. CB00851]OKI31961.1 hypothetical protein A6A25_26285 [Saccharothrix sp. CB00851]